MNDDKLSLEKGLSDFIYMNYKFFEQNIRELCINKEGLNCCADKTKSIMKMYLDYSITNNIPEFNPDIESYWTPNFGNNQMWINLCNGLYKLYHGQPQEYFKAYNELLQDPIRKYKHTLHVWYIKFKDDTIVKFDHTWDDEIDNPLDNKYLDKKDFYIIHNSKVKNKLFDIYYSNSKEEQLLLNDEYVKVPKSDIKCIFKKSEEKLS